MTKELEKDQATTDQIQDDTLLKKTEPEDMPESEPILIAATGDAIIVTDIEEAEAIEKSEKKKKKKKTKKGKKKEKQKDKKAKKEKKKSKKDKKKDKKKGKKKNKKASKKKNKK